MLTDLTTPICVVGLLSLMAFLAGRRLRHKTENHRPWLFLECVAFSVLFSWTLSSKLYWAELVPLPSIVCWSNIVPVFLLFTAGVASGAPGLRQTTGRITVVAFSLIAIGYLVQPIVRPAIWQVRLTEETKWSNGICLQTHPATCGPAAAATLLSHHGITVSEREMVSACLTSTHGTTPLGLYRGIASAERNANRSVSRKSLASIASSNPDAWSEARQLPNAAMVIFDDEDIGTQRLSRRFSQRFTGPRDDGHVVVVLGREGDLWSIADPAIGKVLWTDDEFRRRFTGDAIYLRQID